jgi:hypothetical protein
MTSHAVPRNMGKVERLWKGLPDRYLLVAVAFLIGVVGIMIAFFYATTAPQKVFYAFIFMLLLAIWLALARSPRVLDKSFLFALFYIKGAAGYNLLTKYSMLDSRINKILTIIRFRPDGTIEFKNGYGWLYAFDCDSVSKDLLDGFNKKCQALLNSLTEEVFFKIEVRVEPKEDAQALTQRTNDLINIEKSPEKLAHLKSIHAYSQEKEKNDYERKYYFFIGITGKINAVEANIMKEKIEHGFKDKVNNLNIVFSQIKSPYLLFEFYAGELR